jgi:uncharacterized protein YunC (DUF1805 family)
VLLEAMSDCWNFVYGGSVFALLVKELPSSPLLLLLNEKELRLVRTRQVNAKEKKGRIPMQI